MAVKGRKFNISGCNFVANSCALWIAEAMASLRKLSHGLNSKSRHALYPIHCHLATPDQEEFILLLMMVPRKHSGELHQFEFLAVQLRNDLRSPMLVNQGELFVQGSSVV